MSQDYKDDNKNGETVLTEMFEGQTDIGKTDTYTYLRFVIASNGSNMPNIQNLKCKCQKNYHQTKQSPASKLLF